MPKQTYASKQVRLSAPQGTDEANHGTERYRVDNDGTIEVPLEAAAPLAHIGGFTELKPDVELPADKVRVAHDDDNASCSFRGETIAAAKDGSFMVPVAAVRELQSHGFKPVEA